MTALTGRIEKTPIALSAVEQGQKQEGLAYY